MTQPGLKTSLTGSLPLDKFIYSVALLSAGSPRSKQPLLFEAEFIALAASVQEVIFLRNLLAELGCPQSPTVVYEDNQATIFSLKNLGADHSRTKHIDLRYFFLREKVADGVVIIKYVSTDNNVADALTKPLSPALFERFRPSLVREGVN